MDNAKFKALIKALKDKNPAVRRASLENLETGKESKAAIPALIEALKDEDNYVRFLAAEALGIIDKEFKEVPAIDVMKTLIEVSLIKDEEEAQKANLTNVERYDWEDDSCTLAERANFVIADIAGSSSAAAADLINLLNTPDSRYWDTVVYALSFMLPSQVSLLIEAMRNENALIRLGVIEVLTYVAGDEDMYQEKAVIPALVKALEDENSDVRAAAAKLLKEIEPYCAS